MNSLPRTMPEPESTPLRGGPVLRWGVLAPGEIADAWVSTVHANTDQRVVAVASRSADRAAAFALRHGIERSYGDYEALVADPGVDIVYVAAPHSEHRRLALLALAAGKHVLIEKPIAVSMAEATDIVDAARAAGLFAMEAVWTRFLPQTTIIARLLADGALGRVRTAQADFGARFDFDPSGRWFDPALGGGAMLDLGVYTSWFIQFALGAPSSVVARGTLASTGVDEQVTVLTEHPEGAVGVASVSMLAATPTTAMIVGDDLRVEVGSPFCAPNGIRLVVENGDELRWDDPSSLRWRDGLCYQATAVAAHVAAGRTEAPEHPLETTLDVMRVIVEARTQLGAA